MKYYKDYYKILNLERNASNKEIREAYRRLALESHPDKKDEDNKDSKEFIEISQAYEILKNEDTRTEYNENFVCPSISLFNDMLSKNLMPKDIEDYLQAGADIEVQNKMGQSIIMIAANRGNLPVVEYLLKKGISSKSHDFLKVNVIMFASMASFYKFEQTTEQVEQNDNIKTDEVEPSEEAKNQTSINNTEIDLEEVKSEILVQNDTKVDEIDSPEEPQEKSQEEAKQESQEKFKNDQGANNASGNLPNSEEFISNKAKIISLLLRNGADPLAANVFNGNALGIMKNQGVKEFINAYLNFLNEDVNKQELGGEMPLFDV